VTSRRSFLSSLALGVPFVSAGASMPSESPVSPQPVPLQEDRPYWTGLLTKACSPVLENLSAGTLKAKMPVECPTGKLESRRAVTHLEALGRTLSGLAPWLVCEGLSPAEEMQRARFADLARKALIQAVTPSSPDYLDFTAAAQNLVDAAFLALGLARGRAELWTKLDAATREALIAALQSTRRFVPPKNNWLLFSALVEAFLASAGAEWKTEPIDLALQSHEEWYKGDGTYGDGAQFHWDYYNSYVIHPMLLEVLDLVASVDARWNALAEKVHTRVRRYAAVQERMISPDGSYPALGRSVTYRCGAFHLLATMALRRDLPEPLTSPQVRSGLAAVIRRTLEAPETFDENGWLRVGLAGHQPKLAEPYISTGSLYLCTCAFLPLGLPPADDFWSKPAEPGTSAKIWNGVSMAADHAI